jgi:predicted Rossmann fold nucleotide-binding protein DprA/Smf involved in DNA uptake
LEKGNDKLLVLSETYGKGNSKYESSRIASAISEKLLVFNCGVQSPVLMAVNYFLQAGKDVLVKPTDVGNPNVNNMLIYQGAIPVYNDISIQDQLKA